MAGNRKHRFLGLGPKKTLLNDVNERTHSQQSQFCFRYSTICDKSELQKYHKIHMIQQYTARDNKTMTKPTNNLLYMTHVLVHLMKHPDSLKLD